MDTEERVLKLLEKVGREKEVVCREGKIIVVSIRGKDCYTCFCVASNHGWYLTQGWFTSPEDNVRVRVENKKDIVRITLLGIPVANLHAGSLLQGSEIATVEEISKKNFSPW